MEPVTRTGPRRGGFVAAALPWGLMLVAVAAGPAVAAGCAFEPQGEGRVAAVIDSRTFRLQDGREVRLAGIEPVVAEKASRTSALAAIVAGREVTLRGEDDTPDRYGRQPAFVFLADSETSVQGLLLAQGEALVSTTVTDKNCAMVLIAAETAARDAKRGTWADPAAIKNAESPGDILAGIGRFAVTISRRVTAGLEAAGIFVKSLENRRIRVRGWVETRGGPRIEVLQAGQIELLGEN